MSENNNNHVADQVEAYLDEELSPAERVAFDAHIAACELCRAALAESRQIRGHLRAVFSDSQPSAGFENQIIEELRMATSRRMIFVKPSVRRAAFATAAAVLLVSAGIVVSQSLDVNSQQIAVASSMHPAGVASQFFRQARTQDVSNRVFNGPVSGGRRIKGAETDGDGITDSGRSFKLALTTASEKAEHQFGERDGSHASHGLGVTPPAGEVRGLGSLDASKLVGGRGAGGAGEPTVTLEGADRKLAEVPQSTPTLDYESKVDALGRKDTPVSGKPAAVLALPVQATKEAELAQADKNKNPVNGVLTASLNEKLDSAQKTLQDEGLTSQNAATQAGSTLGRKIIRNATMQFEVERFDDALLRMTKLVTEQGGFVAGTDSDKLPNGKMRGTIILRVPPEHLEALALELRGIGELKSQKIGAEDITRHYTDLESSLRAAHAMQDRLLEIIKSGKGQIKDLLEAEKQLGIWREKSEQIEGEKRYLDNLVSLSTLTIELAERDIRQAAVATETEQVEMSLETEAVDKAYAKAREVIESAKGRVLQSEMKQLDAGQFGATIRAAVPPDVAEQVIAGLRQLNGRIAHFSRESHRTTQEGDASVAAANTVRHDDAIISIQIYNLANIAPRRTTNIVIATTDVEKAYQKLLTEIQNAGGHVMTSSLMRPDANQQTGEIQVQLPAEKADSLELAVTSLGETLRHESTENPDGANVTDAKRGFHFTVVSSTSIAARETRQFALAATSVSGAFESIRQAVMDASGRITQSEMNDQAVEGQSAVLSFDLPRANLPALSAAIDKFAVLLSQSASRSPDTQNTIDSKLRFNLTINSAQRLPPRQTISLGSEVADVNKAVADLTSAVDAAGGRRVDSGGTSQDRTGAVTAEVTVELPADRAQSILDQLEHSGRTFNKRLTFDQVAPQGALARARIQATFSDSARSLGGQESGWDALRRGLETSATGLRWSLQMLVIGACFVAPWLLVIWVGWKLLRRKPAKTAAV